MAPIRNPAVPRFAIVLLLGGALAGFAGISSLVAQQSGERLARRVLVVSGEGEVRARPDQAQLSAGVVTEAKMAADALAQNNALMTKVLAALGAQGVKDKDVQTSGFSVSPQYPPYRPDAPEDRRITGYQVSNQVTVTVADLAKLGPTLDALVKSGANQLHGVSFSIAKPEPLLDRARREAVKNAQAKARGLAEAAGVALGPILIIQEGGTAPPVPEMFKMRAAMAAESVPVAAGEQSVSASVSITYTIQ